MSKCQKRTLTIPPTIHRGHFWAQSVRIRIGHRTVYSVGLGLVAPDHQLGKSGGAADDGRHAAVLKPNKGILEVPTLILHV
jgi:hypothetical protein